MSEWEEFRAWKAQQSQNKTSKESLKQSGVELVPENERKELVSKHCKHEFAEIVAVRPDGLVDCYCPNCWHGGLYNSIDEFKRQ